MLWHIVDATYTPTGTVHEKCSDCCNKYAQTKTGQFMHNSLLVFGCVRWFFYEQHKNATESHFLPKIAFYFSIWSAPHYWSSGVPVFYSLEKVASPEALQWPHHLKMSFPLARSWGLEIERSCMEANREKLVDYIAKWTWINTIFPLQLQKREPGHCFKERGLFFSFSNFSWFICSPSTMHFRSVAWYSLLITWPFCK